LVPIKAECRFIKIVDIKAINPDVVGIACALASLGITQGNPAFLTDLSLSLMSPLGLQLLAC